MGSVASDQSSVIGDLSWGPATIGMALPAYRGSPTTTSIMGYHLDLNTGAFRQRGDLDCRACRKVRREVLGIDLVHPGEVRQVRHEYRALNDIGEGQVLVIQDGFNILQDAVRLRLDVAGDKVPGGRVNGYLTGAEKQVTYAHGVVVRSDCGSGLGWFDDVLLRHCGVILLLRPNGSSRAMACTSSVPRAFRLESLALEPT